MPSIVLRWPSRRGICATSGIMVCNLVLAASLLSLPNTGVGGIDDLLCEPEGMASISFGQLLSQRDATLNERTASGVTYFVVEPTIDISPFQQLIVGITPASRKVFSIRLEMHGDAAELDRIIENFKVALGAVHPGVAWSVIGNHHYGEGLTGMDLALYRIGDSLDGKPSFLLSYDCDSRRHVKELLQEATGVPSPDNQVSDLCGSARPDGQCEL